MITGCDFAGTVIESNAGDSASVQVGDKVAGFVHGGMFEDQGSFAEYVKADADLVVKVPEGVELERASSVGISGYTAAQVCRKETFLGRLTDSISHRHSFSGSNCNLLQPTPRLFPRSLPRLLRCWYGLDPHP